MTPSTPDEIVERFTYKLNAMEWAAQADEPSKVGYAEKRQAVLDFVRKLAEKGSVSHDA